MDGKGNRASWVLKRSAKVMVNSKAEVIAVFFALAYYMPSAFIQNLIIQKLCLQRNYSRDYCLSNAVNETFEEQTQGEVSQLLLYFYLLKTLPAVILALFMGQWCDKYGRKYVMIVSFAGCIFSAILYFVNTVFMDWPPIYVILSALPAGLGGEYAGFMLGIYGFIGDVHPLKSLSVRVSTTDGAEAFSQLIGPLIGGQLYLRFGAEGVFLICAAMLIVGVILTGIFVKDEKFEKRVDNCVVLRDFFDGRGFVSSVAAVFKKREGHFRAYIFCNIISMFISMMTLYGFQEIFILYTRLTVEWSVVTFNFYNGLFGAANAIGNVIVFPILANVFHLSDAVIGLSGLVALVAYYYILAFTRKSTIYYGALSLNVLSNLCYNCFRSIIIKCISFNEIGKVMGGYSVVQTVAINVGQVAAAQIYAHTYRFYPGAVFVFCASVGLICVALYAWIFLDLKKNGVVLEEKREESIKI